MFLCSLGLAKIESQKCRISTMNTKGWKISFWFKHVIAHWIKFAIEGLWRLQTLFTAKKPVKFSLRVCPTLHISIESSCTTFFETTFNSMEASSSLEAFLYNSWTKRLQKVVLFLLQTLSMINCLFCWFLALYDKYCFFPNYSIAKNVCSTSKRWINRNIHQEHLRVPYWLAFLVKGKVS